MTGGPLTSSSWTHHRSPGGNPNETEPCGAYEKLAAHGIRHLRNDGVLVAASCSAHVPATEFFDAVRAAARHSGRPFVELATTLHPEDHPATFPEAHYLKCIYLRGG